MEHTNFSTIMYIALLIVIQVLLLWILLRNLRLKESTTRRKKFSCDFDYENSKLSISFMTTASHVANFISACGSEPHFYVKKEAAKAKGWTTKRNKNNLQQVCPKKAIGGDQYKNKDGQLPPSIKYREFDIEYHGEQRGAKRIVASESCFGSSKISSCNVYLTEDHYGDFTQIL